MEARYGIHTARALENFPLAGRAVHPALARAFGEVKLACALTNRALGAWAGDEAKAEAIERACRELSEGELAGEIVVDALQGGAGTSTNMNVNEVLANRALEILGLPHGEYARVSPLDDINLHQSTNDTYPTALRLAAIRLLHALEKKVVALQESFQRAEKRFAHVVKVGRTEYQDAVLTTLGREMSAYAEAINRDRWRIYKCEERLRVVNLGGTAIGTGLAAPREFIFRAVEQLRALTGIGFARAENLVDATQNADVFVEVSGILKAHAVSLIKICTRPAAAVVGAGRGAGRDSAAGAAGGLVDHAGEGEPGDPRGGDAGGDAGDGQRQRDCGGVRGGQPGAECVSAADCRLPAGDLDVLARADDLLARHLRGWDRGGRGALPGACDERDRRGHGAGAQAGLRARGRGGAAGARAGQDAARCGCGAGLDERGGVR